MSSDDLNPEKFIRKHGDKLPHWQQGEAMQFVTFRLRDALPQELLRQYADHFINVVRHIRNNPVKARLPEGTFTLWLGERAADIS